VQGIVGLWGGGPLGRALTATPSCFLVLCFCTLVVCVVCVCVCVCVYKTSSIFNQFLLGR
jgi:hypothetical protein